MRPKRCVFSTDLNVAVSGCLLYEFGKVVPKVWSSNCKRCGPHIIMYWLWVHKVMLDCSDGWYCLSKSVKYEGEELCCALDVINERLNMMGLSIGNQCRVKNYTLLAWRLSMMAFLVGYFVPKGFIYTASRNPQLFLTSRCFVVKCDPPPPPPPQKKKKKKKKSISGMFFFKLLPKFRRFLQCESKLCVRCRFPSCDSSYFCAIVRIVATSRACALIT